jgi:hypothetical protein
VDACLSSTIPHQGSNSTQKRNKRLSKVTAPILVLIQWLILPRPFIAPKRQHSQQWHGPVAVGGYLQPLYLTQESDSPIVKY